MKVNTIAVGKDKHVMLGEIKNLSFDKKLAIARETDCVKTLKILAADKDKYVISAITTREKPLPKKIIEIIFKYTKKRQWIRPLLLPAKRKDFQDDLDHIERKQDRLWIRCFLAQRKDLPKWIIRDLLEDNDKYNNKEIKDIMKLNIFVNVYERQSKYEYFEILNRYTHFGLGFSKFQFYECVALFILVFLLLHLLLIDAQRPPIWVIR